MKTKLMLIAAVLLVACGSPTKPDGVSIRALPYAFVAPESCARVDGGWVVTDQGCGFEQPCHKATPKGSNGKVILVRDDGTSRVLVDKLIEPNGIDVDSDGNIWFVNGGANEIDCLLHGGGVARLPIDGAKLLNDITIVPWAPNTAWVSDTITGNIHIVSLFDSHLEGAVYATVEGWPNGLAPSNDDDGVTIASLGGLGLKGQPPDKIIPGGTSQVAPAPPAALGACAEWHGGDVRNLGPLSAKHLDGIVSFTHGGMDGYLVSSIYDTSGEGHLDQTLWFVPEHGDATKIIDLAPQKLFSVADIGRNPKTGEICVPDLNGSKPHKDDFGASAKVLIISGLK